MCMVHLRACDHLARRAFVPSPIAFQQQLGNMAPKRGGLRHRLGLTALAKHRRTPLGKWLLTKHFQGKLSGPDLMDAAGFASNATSSGSADNTDVAQMARLHRKGKTRVRRGVEKRDVHNVSRGVIRVAQRDAVLNPPMIVEAPMWDTKRDMQITGSIAVAPPHETLNALVKEGEASRWTSCGPHQQGFQDRATALKARLHLDASADLACIGLWGDGAPLTKNKRMSIELITFRVMSGTVRRRFWVAALAKRMLCQCGCRGKCTYDAVFRVISWSALLIRSLVNHVWRGFHRESEIGERERKGEGEGRRKRGKERERGRWGKP